MLEDLHICTVIDELLQCLLHRLCRGGIALLDRDGLLGHACSLAQGLKLTIGLGDRIAGNRGIGV